MREITKSERDIIEKYIERRTAIMEKKLELSKLTSISVTLWDRDSKEFVTIDKKSDYFSKEDMNCIGRYIKRRLEFESLKNEMELDMYTTLIGYNIIEREKLISNNVTNKK